MKQGNCRLRRGMRDNEGLSLSLPRVLFDLNHGMTWELLVCLCNCHKIKMCPFVCACVIVFVCLFVGFCLGLLLRAVQMTDHEKAVIILQNY